MRWSHGPPYRRSWRKRTATILLLAGVGAIVAGAAVQRSAGSPRGDRPVEIRAEFGRCHEGGGTNCVVDGDTVWIAGEKVRIAGIDAPETHEPRCAREGELGKRSAERLQALLNSGTVTATRGERDRDPNGRLLRNLAVNGRDIGNLLASEGLARAYKGGKRSWC